MYWGCNCSNNTEELTIPDRRVKCIRSKSFHYVPENLHTSRVRILASAHATEAINASVHLFVAIHMYIYQRLTDPSRLWMLRSECGWYIQLSQLFSTCTVGKLSYSQSHEIELRLPEERARGGEGQAKNKKLWKNHTPLISTYVHMHMEKFITRYIHCKIV